MSTTTKKATTGKATKKDQTNSKQREANMKKQDVNEVVFNALNEEENTFHSSLLVASQILNVNQINKAIVDNGFDLSLDTEIKDSIKAEITEIETLISATENSVVKSALESTLEVKKNELQNIESETSPISASSFQESIDKFFVNGLNGLKNKSQLVITEAEASASGTNAVNYFIRQSLLNKETIVNINQDLLGKVSQTIGKHYISKGHINNIVKQLRETTIVSKAYIKNRNLYISY